MLFPICFKKFGDKLYPVASVSVAIFYIITPLLGFLTNNVDLKTLSWAVRPDLVIKYGAFLQAIFNFLVVSISIFVIFKMLSGARERLFRKEERGAIPPQEKPAQERLLEEIRDLLKSRVE